MRSTSVLLAICIITITLSCFASFTQAEGLRYRYVQHKVARADTKNETTGTTGLTTGGTYTTGGSNSTTGLTTGQISSGNSTSNSTGTSGELTSGGGSGSTTGGSGGSSTSGAVSGTTSSTTITYVIFVITYVVKVDPDTFDYAAATQKLSVEFGIDADKLKLILQKLAATKRSVEAVGDYELVVTIKAVLGEDAIADKTQEQMAVAANTTSALTALQSAGVVSISGVKVARSTEVVTVTSTGSGSTTAGTPDSASGGLSAGAIAGIVIAVVAVVAIVVVAVVISKKRAKKHSQVQPLLNGHNNGGNYP